MIMNTTKFDFSAPAELYGGGGWIGRPTSIAYRKFDTSAEAIRYAVEELSEARRRPCIMEVNERRFNHIDIRKLYDHGDYPLPRKAEKDKDAT
jgi:hypothetical protein